MRLAVRSRDFVPPRKILILKPCCLSQVMLATPLLYQLRQAYPRAQIDWAVGAWARPAIATNPHLNELIDTADLVLPTASWQAAMAFGRALRLHEYDTCFIPSRSAVLSLVAWHAHIPQRVGLDSHGRGLGHTISVTANEQVETSAAYLRLAEALGIDTAEARAEFFPTDEDRQKMIVRLADEVAWQGDTPLVILHPGGGENPIEQDERKRWPVERFARLGNHLVRQKQAKVVLVGGVADVSQADAVAGLMSSPVLNLAGQTTLGELGALCEVASLYVGNDAGATHISAAVGCATLAIYGPTNPLLSRPHGNRLRLRTLWHPTVGAFSWDNYLPTEEVIAAADELMETNA